VTRRPVLLPILACFALTLVSCGATLWSRPAAEVQADLAAGRTGFLLAKTSKDLADTDLGALGPGAAWNLGTLYATANRLVEAETLWKRSLATEPPPFRDAAGTDLFDLYAGRRDWPKAEAVALKLNGFDGGRLEFQRSLFEAYYFQKKDERAWAIFQSWQPGSFPADQELENQLFFGVLSARAGKTDEAAQALSNLVFDRPASVLQFRLESFFQEDEARYDLLGPGGREAVAFQSLVYRGAAKEAVAWLKGRKLPAGFWNHRALVEGLETLFKAEGRAETGLRILDGLPQDLTGDARFALDFARGRLQRSLGWWAQARTAFRRALAEAPTPDDIKKTSWNWLNAWVEAQPSGALGPFLQVYAGTDDPSYFTDVFEDWTTALVQQRRWGLLAAVVRDLGHRLPAEDQATVSFVLARLASHGLVNLEAEGIHQTPADLLARSIAVQPFSYEALVARAALGQPLTWPEAPTGPSFVATDRSRAQTALWDSQLAFGLDRRVAAEVSASTDPLDPAFALRAVDLLQARESWRPSLLILYRLLKEPGQVLTQDLAGRLYPKAYAELITARAEAEKVDPDLLFGLIREESTFDPAAKSWVGAQGLSQLMPQTAAETAKGLRLKKYDLAVPADNLALGARYLATMIRSQGRIYLALMAYNAGGGRIRPWKEAMGKLPEEIFVEAAPFAETRGYVKKILTSAVMTGTLHDGRSLDEMVKLIYPGFRP